MSQGKEKPPCGGQIPTAVLRGRSHQPLAGGFGGPHPHSGKPTDKPMQGQRKRRQTNCRSSNRLACATQGGADVPAWPHPALAEDRKDLKKLAGIVVPIYATAMVAMLALVVIIGGS